MSDNIFSIVSFECDFPLRLYQLPGESFTEVEISSPLSVWKLADCERGVYEKQGDGFSCEPHLFERNDRGLWDMSDEEVGEYAV